MQSYVFLIILILVVLFFSKHKPKKKKRSAQVTSKVSTKIVNKKGSSSVDREERRYISDFVTAVLPDYNVFLSAYLSRFSATYLRSGSVAKFTEEDLVEGVELNYAGWVLYHCVHLASARYSAICKINNSDVVEARSIKFSVFRSNPSCPLVPKNKNYRVGSQIPIYPCADCHEDEPCLFFYDYGW